MRRDGGRAGGGGQPCVEILFQTWIESGDVEDRDPKVPEQLSVLEDVGKVLIGFWPNSGAVKN